MAVNTEDHAMQINTRPVQHVLVVEIIGELDGRTVPEAEERILVLVQPECRIVLDLTQVTYVSSAGLRMFLLLSRRATSNKGYVALLGLSEEIRDTMDITGFLNHFTTYETLDAALEALPR
jgi:anti-sigma B factor antagonist